MVRVVLFMSLAASLASRTLASARNASNTSTAFVSAMGTVLTTSVDSLASSSALKESSVTIDTEYPGTAVERMHNVRQRVQSLRLEELSTDWTEVRRKLLWAGGLKDLTEARPGHGYTGHAFNDYNHVDLTTMVFLDNIHDGTSIAGIAKGNLLGPGIRVASLPELGPGGSWSTCAIGCHHNPPRDVAHVQFQSRIAFKLVWVPPSYQTFVLVDDDGKLLNTGHPTGKLPPLRERQQNYHIVMGSKYSVEADKLLKQSS